MSEDEAFIRAIVDSPGDDTPRLVYADWLDDRSDPRGPYLRAEREWASSGRKEKALRAQAAPLDPVWVARVSRPPVGVCADKIVMRTERAPATVADLDTAEVELKAKLPSEFRALLMNWNGAVPSINVPRPPSPSHDGLSEIANFLCVLAVGQKRRTQGTEEWDLVEATVMLRECLDFYRNTPDEYLPVAAGGGDELDLYLIGVRGKAAGKVAHLVHFHDSVDPLRLSVVFPSLGALLASVIAEAPEWYRLAKNGDIAGLLAWIDAGGDVNARYEHPLGEEERPLTVAIGENNLPPVRELLAGGARVTKAVRQRAEWLRGSDKRKMLAALPAELGPKKRKK